MSCHQRNETTPRAFIVRIRGDAPAHHHRLVLREWNNILSERLPGLAYFPLIGKHEKLGSTEVRVYQMQADDDAWEAYSMRGESYKPYVQARVESANNRAMAIPAT